MNGLFKSFYPKYKSLRLINEIKKHKEKPFHKLLILESVKEAIGVHEFNGVKWFNKDGFIETINYIFTIVSFELINI